MKECHTYGVTVSKWDPVLSEAYELLGPARLQKDKDGADAKIAQCVFFMLHLYFLLEEQLLNSLDYNTVCSTVSYSIYFI